MSYVNQGDVNYRRRENETLLEWNLRVRQEYQAEQNKAAVDKKIAEAEAIAKRIPMPSSTDPSLNTFTSPRAPGKIDGETIAIMGAAALLAIYAIRG